MEQVNHQKAELGRSTPGHPDLHVPVPDKRQLGPIPMCKSRFPRVIAPLNHSPRGSEGGQRERGRTGAIDGKIQQHPLARRQVSGGAAMNSTKNAITSSLLRRYPTYLR